MAKFGGLPDWSVGRFVGWLVGGSLVGWAGWASLVGFVGSCFLITCESVGSHSLPFMLLLPHCSAWQRSSHQMDPQLPVFHRYAGKLTDGYSLTASKQQ